MKLYRLALPALALGACSFLHPAPPALSAHAGKIFFASESVREEAIPGGVAQQATLGQALHGRAFFDARPVDKLADCHGGNRQLTWMMRAQGSQDWQVLAVVPAFDYDFDKTSAYLDAKIFGPDDNRPNRALARYLEGVERDGLVLELEVVASCNPAGSTTPVEVAMAHGRLPVVSDEASWAAFVKSSEALPQQRFADAQAQAAIEAVVRKQLAIDGQVLWLRIPQEDWSIIRTDSGRPLYRAVNVVVAGQAGDKCTLYGLAVRQEATGGGKFSKTLVIEDSQQFAERRPVTCSSLR